MSDRPIRSNDSDDVIEANIEASIRNNEEERTLVIEHEGEAAIHATEVPRDEEHREAIDTSPIGYRRDVKERDEFAHSKDLEAAYSVGPLEGEGTPEGALPGAVDADTDTLPAGSTSPAIDKDGNLIHDPGIGPGYVAPLPGKRDEDGNLIADHDGDGIAAAHEGDRADHGAGGPTAEARRVDHDAGEPSEEEQHGGRGEHTNDPGGPDRDLDAALENLEELAEEEDDTHGGRGEEDRDLGDAEGLNELPNHEGFKAEAVVSAEAAGDTGEVPGDKANKDELIAFCEANGIALTGDETKAEIREKIEAR